MTDTITKEQRSKNMAAIHSKDTSPEQYIRKLLFAKGFRYRKNTNRIVGHPDIFLTKYNSAIFIHGCFWHRHSGCKYSYFPQSNTEYWQNKFQNNVTRDEYVKAQLRINGIKCLIIWECTVKKMKRDDYYKEVILESIIDFFENNNLYKEL